MTKIIFLTILAYLLGSIPFGYIVTKLSVKKDILKIGWRKTSGSNVFKNIGIWQGIVTGIGDVGKGFLAVSIAQNCNVPGWAQALVGTAAIVGNNWSCFLKFSGGRGIGTFIGAALSFFPKTLALSLIPLIFTALIWNASLGTILSLISFILLSFRFNQFKTAGLFGLMSLIPIFFKRLSPIEEIKKSQDKASLIRNRFIFDDDKMYLELRIKKIFERLTKS